MSLNIKNQEANELARALAAQTGETMTAAVTTALRERLDRLRHEATIEERTQRILELGRAIAATMPPDAMSVADLHDERGLPA